MRRGWTVPCLAALLAGAAAAGEPAPGSAEALAALAVAPAPADGAHPGDPAALAALVTSDVIVSVTPSADAAALVALAQGCVGRPPEHPLTRIVRLEGGTLPYGLTGFTDLAADGSATVVVLDGVFDRVIGHELGHLWFAGGNAVLDEGRAELVGRCVQTARGVPVSPSVVESAWTLPDLTRFRTHADADGLEALGAAYDGSRKLFVALAELVDRARLLGADLRYWGDVRRVVIGSGDRGAWLMGELAQGVDRQRELFADPDHDGASTLVETLDGTDPVDPDSDDDGWPDGRPDDVPAGALPVLGDGMPTCLPAALLRGEERTLGLTMMLADGQRVTEPVVLRGFASAFTSVLLDHTVLAWVTSEGPAPDALHPTLCRATPAGTVVVARPWARGAAPAALGDLSFDQQVSLCAAPDAPRACGWVRAQVDHMATATTQVASALVGARRRAADTYQRPIPRLFVALHTPDDGLSFGEMVPRIGFDLEAVRRVHDADDARDLAELATVMGITYDAGSIFFARDARLALGKDFLTRPAAAEALWWDADRTLVRQWRQRVANCRAGWAGVLSRDCY